MSIRGSRRVVGAGHVLANGCGLLSDVGPSPLQMSAAGIVLAFSVLVCIDIGFLEGRVLLFGLLQGMLVVLLSLLFGILLVSDGFSLLMLGVVNYRWRRRGMSVSLGITLSQSLLLALEHAVSIEDGFVL